MRKTLIFTVLVCVAYLLNAQVTTRFSSEKSVLESLEPIKNHKTAKIVKQFTASNIEIQTLIKEDSVNIGRDVPFRFGKGFDTDITLLDGIYGQK